MKLRAREMPMEAATELPPAATEAEIASTLASMADVLVASIAMPATMSGVPTTMVLSLMKALLADRMTFCAMAPPPLTATLVSPPAATEIATAVALALICESEVADGEAPPSAERLSILLMRAST